MESQYSSDTTFSYVCSFSFVLEYSATLVICVYFVFVYYLSYEDPNLISTVGLLFRNGLFACCEEQINGRIDENA